MSHEAQSRNEGTSEKKGRNEGEFTPSYSLYLNHGPTPTSSDTKDLCLGKLFVCSMSKLQPFVFKMVVIYRREK